MSVFDELLAIKRFRESQAEMAVSKQRNAHAEAERAYQYACEQLASFRDTQLERAVDSLRGALIYLEAKGTGEPAGPGRGANPRKG